MRASPPRPEASRRQFLKSTLALGAVGAAGSQLTGCRKDEDVDWDEETDVLVVGAGGAGLTAALEASTAGAEVLVLEKAEEPGGTTALSGGVIQGSGTAVQLELGVVDPPADHLEFYLQAGEGVPDPVLLQVLVDDSADAIAFMQGLGLEYSSVYPVDPIATVDDDLRADRIHRPSDAIAGGRGLAHVTVLLDALDQRDVEIRTNASVDELVEDPDHGIVGVRVRVGNRRRYIRARRAVVLASGGMDWSVDLARAFSPQQLWELETGRCACALTNTGDGITLGMDVGADLAGLGGTIGVPDVAMGRSLPGLWVNVHGQRFVHEGAHYAYAMRAVFDQEEHTAWAIFDQTVADLGWDDLGYTNGTVDPVAAGTVKRGLSLPDLAGVIGVNGPELVRTVERWNIEAGLGQDPLFGRTEQLEPLTVPPYYAVPVTSWNLGTCGGLRIDRRARVIDLFGQPIPRLYAAGMVAGGFLGPYYPGSGTAILSTVVFGRRAGLNASAQTALEPVRGLDESR